MDGHIHLGDRLASRASSRIWKCILIFCVAQIKARKIFFDQHLQLPLGAQSQAFIDTDLLTPRPFFDVQRWQNHYNLPVRAPQTCETARSGRAPRHMSDWRHPPEQVESSLRLVPPRELVD